MLKTQNPELEKIVAKAVANARLNTNAPDENDPDGKLSHERTVFKLRYILSTANRTELELLAAIFDYVFEEEVQQYMSEIRNMLPKPESSHHGKLTREQEQKMLAYLNDTVRDVTSQNQQAYVEAFCRLFPDATVSSDGTIKKLGKMAEIV